MRCIVCDKEEAEPYKLYYCSARCYNISHKDSNKQVGRAIYEYREKNGLGSPPKPWTKVPCANPNCSNYLYAYNTKEHSYCSISCRNEHAKILENIKIEKDINKRKKEAVLDGLTRDAVDSRNKGLTYGEYTGQKYAPRWNKELKQMFCYNNGLFM